jgi:hypothetical protein
LRQPLDPIRAWVLLREDGAVFTEAALLDAAGPVVFERGLGYVRYIRGLQVQAGQATASIQAKRVYSVRLTWAMRSLDGECSCPHNFEGYFCKHLVAVGLAVLDADPAPVVSEVEGDALRKYLDELDRAVLIELVAELIARDESAFRLVQARAVEAGSAAAVNPDELTRAVSTVMPRGFVDYRASFDAARDVQVLLDDLEALLDAGAADQVRQPLERAVTRLRKVMLDADDSAGVLGDACQRAAELHARACVESAPDGVKLARWLMKFRVESPGWPDVTLGMYASALGQRGLGMYRTELARQDALHAEADRFSRFEIDRMLLELADHDGDVDEAVRLLSRDAEHTAYGAIITRLQSAERDRAVLEWVDRAVGAGRLSHHGDSRSNDYWLAPAQVSDIYRSAGRADDAIGVLRDHFRRRPGPDSLRLLIGAADSPAAAERDRAWALTTAEQDAARRGDGSALIRIAIADGDLVAAWSAAEHFGAGEAWRELADASADDVPFDAAQLYRPYLDKLLRDANTRIYPEVARTLLIMRDLYVKVGEQEAFRALLGELRERYKRRTSLIAALDRAGLRSG